MGLKIKITTLLSMLFCFSIILGIRFGTIPTYLLTIIWFIFALLYRKPIGNINYSKFNKLLMVFISMPIIIQLYSVIVIMIRVGKLDYFSYGASTFLAIILAYTVLILFKRQSLQICFLVIFLSWFVVFIKEFFVHGFSIITNAIAQGWLGRSVVNVLESHELVLAAVYYWCVFLFIKGKEKKRTFFLTVLMFLMCFLGVKRIGMIAIIITTVVFLLFKNLKIGKKKRMLHFLGICGILVCLFYLFFIYNTHLFNEFLSKYGIDTMARNIFYEYICSKVKLSFSFMGLGRGSVMALMKQQYSGYLYVHSDILRMYIELGFPLFIFWLYYYFVFITNYIRKEFGIDSSIAYFICIVFTFVLYLTDNTESYFICIFIRTLIPMYFCIYLEYFTTNGNQLFRKVNGKKNV